jgi:hypothetical protein
MGNSEITYKKFIRKTEGKIHLVGGSKLEYNNKMGLEIIT